MEENMYYLKPTFFMQICNEIDKRILAAQDWLKKEKVGTAQKECEHVYGLIDSLNMMNLDFNDSIFYKWIEYRRIYNDSLHESIQERIRESIKEARESIEEKKEEIKRELGDAN